MNISKSRLKQIIKEELEIAEMETIFEEDDDPKSDVVALMSSDQLTFSEKKQLMNYVSTFGVDRGLQKFKGYIEKHGANITSKPRPGDVSLTEDEDDGYFRRQAEGDGYKDFQDAGDRGDHWESYKNGKYIEYYQLGYDNAAEQRDQDEWHSEEYETLADRKFADREI
tara:strand:+ start:962 stop:1465 length:504 start_codon:yes stop_codon:yes gene_type:complete